MTKTTDASLGQYLRLDEETLRRLSRYFGEPPTIETVKNVLKANELADYAF